MKIETDHGGAGTPKRRREESSVVFSLANLRQLVDAQPSQPTRAPLPSFAGSELVGVMTAAQPRRAPMIVPAAAPSNTALMLALTALIVVVFGLAAYVIATPPQHIVITRVVVPEDEGVQPEPEPVLAIATPVQEEVAEPKHEDPVAEGLTSPRTRTRTQPRERHEHTVAPLPEPERRGDVPLECVLDPNLPKCVRKTTTTPRTDTKSPKVDPDLPETLGSTAIRNGIAAVKPAAKMCREKFGAADGEKVRVKLSIVGATGAVSSTAAEDQYRGTALGNCVAAALKKATFPQFRKSVIGVEYTITL